MNTSSQPRRHYPIDMIFGSFPSHAIVAIAELEMIIKGKKPDIC